MKNEPKRVAWPTFRSGVADALNGEIVELSGWMMALDAHMAADYCLLLPEAPCCGTHVPADPFACVEVFAAQPMPFVATDAIVLRGRLRRLIDDPTGWRYQLVDAELVATQRTGVSRRAFLASGAALGLAASAGVLRELHGRCASRRVRHGMAHAVDNHDRHA